MNKQSITLKVKWTLDLCGTDEGLPSELPALEMPFGGQFWGGQFWVRHSSELPALFILFFCVDMTFNWFQMLFRELKALLSNTESRTVHLV